MNKPIKELRAFEAKLFVLGLFATLGFICFLMAIVTVPIDNYFQAAGTLQFQGEQTVVSDVEGVVAEVSRKLPGRIARGEPVLKIVDEQKMANAKTLNLRISLLASQLSQLEKLTAVGALEMNPVEIKRLELAQAQQELAELRKVFVVAARNGFFHYLNPPQTLMGTFVRKGDIVGYLSESQEKVVDVTLPATWVDRFEPGMKVRVYYRNPVSYLSHNVPAILETIHVNTAESRFRAVCRLLASPEEMESFRPGVQVKTSFLVNSTSIFQEIFGIDLYSLALSRIAAWRTSHAGKMANGG